MSDQATKVAARDDFLRHDGKLRIARREEMSLNTPVDLPCSQPSHPELPASAGGIKP